jgi:putative ABC transport system permease protein
MQDIRYGFRMLFKNPATTILAVIALAIGIGANSIIFSIVNSLLFSPMPFIEMENMMRLYQTHEENGIGEAAISGPNYLDIKERCQSFESVTLVTTQWFNVSGEGQPERVNTYLFTPDIFPLVLNRLELGRPFLPEEDRDGKNHVVILSYGFWKERFGCDQNAVGKSIKLDGALYTIIGVLPSELGFFEGEARLWLPLPYDWARENRSLLRYNAIARLKKGVSIAQARTELGIISKSLAEEYPNDNQEWNFGIEPMFEKVMRFLGPTLVILHGVVGFVLLISCSIVASLLLARSAGRQREIAIRSAMGASRGRVIRQMLTESVILATCGGLVGLMFTLWGIDLIKTLMPAILAPFLTRGGINITMLVFTLIVSMLTGLLFGLVPALQTTKPNLTESLNEGGRGSSGKSKSHRTLRILVVSEIALSLVLLIGAGLMVNSFYHLQKVNPGFIADNLLTFHVVLSESKYEGDSAKRSFYRELAPRIAGLPGVESTGVTDIIPLTWGRSIPYEIEGQHSISQKDQTYAQVRRINPDYFQTLKIPLLQGRYFQTSDENEDNRAIIVNEFLSRRFGEGVSAIGKYINIPEWGNEPFEIVGVVGNIKQNGLKNDYQAELYIPFLCRPADHISFAVHTKGDPNRLTSAVREQIWALDPDLPINRILTMEESIAQTIYLERFGTVFMSLFSFVSLILASLGIYGIMAYSVSQRRHEIGVRMAIGAQMLDVIKLVVGQGTRLVIIGVVIGLLGSFVLTRILASQLYGISATDPLTYAYVSLLLILISLLACYIPARKASKVDPMVTLRCE